MFAPRPTCGHQVPPWPLCVCCVFIICIYSVSFSTPWSTHTILIWFAYKTKIHYSTSQLLVLHSSHCICFLISAFFLLIVCTKQMFWVIKKLALTQFIAIISVLFEPHATYHHMFSNSSYFFSFYWFAHTDIPPCLDYNTSWTFMI